MIREKNSRPKQVIKQFLTRITVIPSKNKYLRSRNLFKWSIENIELHHNHQEREHEDNDIKIFDIVASFRQINKLEAGFQKIKKKELNKNG